MAATKVRAPAVAEATLFGVPMRYLSMVMLVGQTVGVVFLMRLSRTVETEGPRYLNSTAVCLAEALKVVCSFVFLSYEKGSTAIASTLVVQAFTRNPIDFAKVSIPSLLYTVQNNLLFLSLSNLSAAVYQVTYQLKILTTAVLSVVILGKVLTGDQWFALFLLTSGVALIQVPRGGEAPTQAPSEGNAVLGLTAVLCACFTSGLAGVYLEKILKGSDHSIWFRNIQLGTVGTVLALLGVFMQDSAAIEQDGFFQGYNGLVWGVVLLQAVGGLVVAAVLKYADNIQKCFGNGLSIVISCIISAVWLKELEPDLLFFLGTMCTLSATSLYSLGPPECVTSFIDTYVKTKHKGEEMANDV